MLLHTQPNPQSDDHRDITSVLFHSGRVDDRIQRVHIAQPIPKSNCEAPMADRRCRRRFHLLPDRILSIKTKNLGIMLVS